VKVCAWTLVAFFLAVSLRKGLKEAVLHVIGRQVRVSIPADVASFAASMRAVGVLWRGGTHPACDNQWLLAA
jgi:hypothetical protein